MNSFLVSVALDIDSNTRDPFTFYGQSKELKFMKGEVGDIIIALSGIKPGASCSRAQCRNQVDTIIL